MTLFDTLLTPELTGFASTFLFIFAIAFAMMAYSKVLHSKSASAVIALVIAFFAATYAPLVAFMTQFMPLAAGGLVVLFFIVFVRDVLFGGKKGKSDPMPAAIGLGLALLVLGVIWPKILQLYGFVGIGAENIVYALAIVAIVIIFWAAYKAFESGGGSPAAAPTK